MGSQTPFQNSECNRNILASQSTGNRNKFLAISPSTRDWEQTAITEGSYLEIVEFVGGG
jgi:hypothetical protein